MPALQTNMTAGQLMAYYAGWLLSERRRRGRPRIHPPKPVSTDPHICGARLPTGPCQLSPAEGKRRCRLHGGAPGSGAPKGNQNALTHGLTTRYELERIRYAKKFFRDLKRERRKERSDPADHLRNDAPHPLCTGEDAKVVGDFLKLLAASM